MYIQKHLLMRINEYMFVNFKDWKEQVTTDVKILSKIQDILEERRSTEDLEIRDQVHDLYNLAHNLGEDYESKFAKNVNEHLLNTSKSLELSLRTVSVSTLACIDILKRSSINSCIVGGYLRDTLTCKHNKDVDFVTDASIEIIQEAFEKRGWKVQHEGKQFLVCIVSKDGEQFEIANFRKDTDNSGGVIGTIKEDAARRDFTCNALYYNLNSQQVIDPNGTALDDIHNNRLRFIGNAKDRIKEDPNRVFRFYRFVSKGFIPDNKSLKAARELFEYSIKNTSPERIRSEIERITGLI